MTHPPVRRDEVPSFNRLLDEYHWLGHNLVGEAIRYIALKTNALSLWSASGLLR
ncbi:unnamed protein product [Acidithrix sp. C25]|nr:unnamed protein product [Acidithrix sp. C25]